MLFESRYKGKVIINLKIEDERLTSSIQRKGIAEDNKLAVSAVLATYISMCKLDNKDPVKLLEKNLDRIGKIIDQQENS